MSHLSPFRLSAPNLNSELSTTSTNPKKRRKNVQNQIQTAPNMQDLLPPPLSGYGDTIVASNPFDDCPSSMSSVSMVRGGPGMGMGPNSMAMNMHMTMCRPMGNMGSPLNPMMHSPQPGPHAHAHSHSHSHMMGSPMMMNGPGPGPGAPPGRLGVNGPPPQPPPHNHNHMGHMMNSPNVNVNGPMGSPMHMNGPMNGPMNGTMGAHPHPHGPMNAHGHPHTHSHGPGPNQGPGPMNGMNGPQAPPPPSSHNVNPINMNTPPGAGGGGGGAGHGHGPPINNNFMMAPMNALYPKPMPVSAGKVYPADQPMVFNSQNPNAPPIYPCGVCHKEVHDNDQAILCESGCNFWFHRGCTGLTEAAYQLLTAEVYAEWACDKCLGSKNIPLVKFKP